MEDSLSLPELEALLEAIRQKESREQRFAAALKGIDLDADEEKSKFDEVQERVNARLRGESTEEFPGFMIKTE